MGQRLEAADVLAKTYASYQKMFGVHTFDQADLEVVKVKYETIQKLWSTIKVWIEKQKIWRESQFTDLKVEDVANEVEVMFKLTYNLNKKLDSKVSEQLRDGISEFKSMVPQILDLGNPNMRRR